jgi:hypothetical protein
VKYLFEDVCVAPTELKSNKPFFFFVNGHHVYNQGVFDESQCGMRMEFER